MADAHDRIEAHVWRISAVVVLGSIMSILDTTIVNVALATLGRDLHGSITQIQWVVTGYMLALAAVIPVSGWAAERFGAKRMYLISLVLFTAGSMLCGISTDITQLVIFRVIQGVGGGMILVPLYWQEIRHESVIDTGLLVGPQGLGAALVMPLAGKLTDRMGGGPLALFGVLLTTVATVPFGLIGAHTSIAWLCAAMFVRGMGIGFAFMPAMTAAFAALERSELADATPQLNVLQRVGGSLGTAVLAVVLQRALVGTHSLAGAASAYGTAFWASAALTAVAVVPCIILLRAERAARARKGHEVPGSEAALEAAAA